MRWVLFTLAVISSTQAFAQAGPVGGSGRYVIVHSPHVQRDTVLLDTVTGKTWQLQSHTFRESEPVVWTPMYREDNPAEYAELQKYYSIKKPVATPK
jgi:hypothetical protein